MSDFNTPPECVGCPRLLEIASEIDAIEAQKSMVTEFAVSDAVPTVLRQALHEVIGMPDDIAAETVNDNMGTLRKQVADQLDDIDKQQDFLKLTADVTTDDCLGKLRMGAQTKAGRTVTATVCGSSAAPSGLRYEVVHIERAERS